MVGDGTIYQSLFKYQKDKQWIGEIKRYILDATGAITSDAPILTSAKLKTRAASSGSYSTGGRSIWTVGYNPLCKNSVALSNDANNNSFNQNNSAALQNLLFNCPPIPDANVTSELINFTRGLNADGEEVAPLTVPRDSVLGDTYHSEMVMVGVPNAPWSSDANMFGKSEAYYRFMHGYSEFIAANANRRSQTYVGSNDGMVHAFDLDLEER
uniref:Tfp pilus assembly protein tip-associated adhesin PilY1-like protein n=1 Tax=Polynucleobacter necessarius subsp. necessarius (strain STIR1) TaxID=452638 RepID=B1XUC9_POLNS